MKILTDFVEGKITFSDFWSVFLNNPTIESYLKNDPTLEKGSYIGSNTYDFIMTEGTQKFGKKVGWERTGSQLNIFGAVCQHLSRKGIPFIETNIYKERYNLLLDCQPSWLDIDESFLFDEIIKKAPAGVKKSELKKWIKNRIKEMFRYASSPPRWIQNPGWPIIDNRPSVFLCQQNINNYFHDSATVYVFIDEDSKEIHTVLQVF
jgi:hypothetical protein